MDGMFYRGEGQDRIESAEKPPGNGRLVLVTVAFAAGVVAMMLCLRMAGLDIPAPSEFPPVVVEGE